MFGKGSGKLPSSVDTTVALVGRRMVVGLWLRRTFFNVGVLSAIEAEAPVSAMPVGKDLILWGQLSNL